MPAETVSDEIRHLMKDKGYSQKRAVAAAMSMQRAGKIKKGGKRKRRSQKSRRKRGTYKS